MRIENIQNQDLRLEKWRMQFFKQDLEKAKVILSSEKTVPLTNELLSISLKLLEIAEELKDDLNLN